MDLTLSITGRCCDLALHPVSQATAQRIREEGREIYKSKYLEWWRKGNTCTCGMKLGDESMVEVSVDGRLRYHSWMKNEEKRHALSVLVTDIEFADSKGVGKDTVSAQGQSAEPETYDADIPF